jgi:hypothetical protein
VSQRARRVSRSFPGSPGYSWGAHRRSGCRGRFGGPGSTELAGVAGWRFTLRGRASVRRGVGCGAASHGRPHTASAVWRWSRRCRDCRQPAAEIGANVLWAEPRGVPRLEELETAPPAKRTRAQKGPLASRGAVELARPGRVEPVASEPSGPHRLCPLTDRVRNPMGACRVKHTGEVPGGVNRQEGVKP